MGDSLIDTSVLKSAGFETSLDWAVRKDRKRRGEGGSENSSKIFNLGDWD